MIYKENDVLFYLQCLNVKMMSSTGNQTWEESRKANSFSSAVPEGRSVTRRLCFGQHTKTNECY